MHSSNLYNNQPVNTEQLCIVKKHNYLLCDLIQLDNKFW